MPGAHLTAISKRCCASLLLLCAPFSLDPAVAQDTPPAPVADSLEPVVVGERSKVGKETLGKKVGKKLIGGAIGGLLGGRGGGRGGGSDGPKTRRDPTRKLDYVEFDKPDVEIRAGARSRWTDDGLLISTRIDKHGEKGTFHSVYLESCDGRRLYPKRIELYDLWAEATLTVSWTRTTYVDGQIVSQESGGWSESWTEKLGRFTRDDEPAAGIWQLVGFDRAHAGIQQLGTYFNIEPAELAELGQLALISHITRPEQDPVITEPFNWLISGDDPEQPDIGLPTAPADDGGTVWEEFSRNCPGTRTREGPPVVSTPPPDEPVTTPPEQPPIISIPPERDAMACSAPALKPLPEPALKAQLAAPANLKAFPWPRPVPLQIRARDYDTLRVSCSGCGDGQSELNHPLEDAIGGVRWQLTGEGSLNDPFTDTFDLDAIQREIDALRSTIRELSGEMEALKLEKENLDQTRADRRARLQADIAALEAERADLQARLDGLRGELAAADREQTRLEDEIADKRRQIDEKSAEIESHRSTIEELNEKIAGKPSAEAQALEQELAALETDLEAAQARLAALRDRQLQNEQALRTAMDQAEVALDQAIAARDNLLAQGQAIQNRIRGLENRLFSTPLMRRLLESRRGIDVLRQEYASVTGSPPTGANPFANPRQLIGTTGAERQAALDAIGQRADALLAEVRGGCAGAGCGSLVARLEREVAELRDLLDQVRANPNALIDPAVAQQLDQARRELRDLNPRIADAESAVESARRDLDNARRALLDALRQAEAELSVARGEITQIEQRIAEVAGRLAEQQRNDQLETERMRPQWEAEIAALRDRINALTAEIDTLRTTLASLSEQLIVAEREVTRLHAEIAALEESLAAIERQLARKREQLQALENEADTLQRQIDELQRRIDALEQQLADLMARASAEQNGTKQANGMQAWYVPPPLERLLTDKNEFERLKREVGDKEAELAAAEGAKQGLQKEAFGIIRDTVSVLWAWKSADERVKALEAELDELAGNKARQQADNAAAGQQRLREAQQRRDRIEAEKPDAEAELAAARERESQRQGFVDDATAALEQAVQALEQAETALAEAEGQLRFQVRNREAKQATVSQLRGEHEQLSDRIRAQQAELATIDRSISRETAAGNESGAENLRQARAAAARRLRDLEQSLDQSRGLLDAAEADLAAAVSAEQQAAEQFSQAQADRVASDKALRDARARHGSITTALDAARLERERAERELAQIDNRLAQAGQDIERINREIAESDATAELDKQIQAKQKEKGDAENDRNAAAEQFSQLTTRRERFWQQDREADQRIDDARAALARANADLRAFLEQEINRIDLSVQIQLDLADAPIDALRAGDPPARRTIQIRYRGRDLVQLLMPDADPDLAPPPPSTVPALCMAQLDLQPDAAIQQQTKPAEAAQEPITIALWYRKGEPLYTTWPPARERPDPRSSTTTTTVRAASPPLIVPPDSGLPLMRAADWWRAAGTDTDRLIARCTPGGGGGTGLLVGGSPIAVESGETPETPEAPLACGPGPDEQRTPADLVHSRWQGPAPLTHANEDDWMLKVPDVPADKCQADTDIDLVWTDRPGEFHDQSLLADDPPLPGKARMRFQPGLVGDYTPRGVEFDRRHRVGLRVQLFDGEHKGLAGERLEWRVHSVNPALENDKYGFTEARVKQLPDERTDPAGYSRVDLFFETRYGEATVEAVWKRGDSDCKTITIPVRRELTLNSLAIGFAPADGWPQGEKFFTDGGSLEDLTADLGDSTETAPVYGVGVLDDQLEPYDEAGIEFTPLAPPGYDKLDPTSRETRTYGLAWTVARDLPEEAEVEIEARIEAELEPFTNPSSVKEKLATARVNRFRIGPQGAELTIETDEGFVPGAAAWSGTGRLVITDAVNIPRSFTQLDLIIEGLEVDPNSSAEEPLATAGTVRWPAGDGAAFEFQRSRFQFRLSKLGLSAGRDGIAEGTVAIATGDNARKQVNFSATIGPNGFYGALTDMPEIELAGMKLEQGASVELDLHDNRDPTPAIDGWRKMTGGTGQGLLIRQGRIVLPEALKGANETPPTLAVKDLVLAAAGVSGEVTLTHTISAGMGRLTFSINEVTLKLNQNQPTGTVIKGALKLPDPYVGEVLGEIAIDAGNQYKFVVSTETPVSAPSLGMVFHIRQLMGEYASEKFTFEIKDALVRSETFSDFDIAKFKFDSDGNLDADLQFDQLAMKFGPGFDIELNRLAFSKQERDVRLAVSSAFKFASIRAERVDFAITNGPTIESLSIAVDYQRAPPVKVTGSIDYRENLFEGRVDVDARAFALNGTMVMGANKTEAEQSWTFWYVELNSRTAIPLGQSGISITELGGGVGWNYDPPIGSTPGNPRKTDALSLKASIGMGDTPTNGRAMAGRTQLVLVRGRFSINGKLWVLDREESMYGEGQLNYYWEPAERVDGFVRMALGIPDQAGKIVSLNGEVGFRFAGPDDWEIRSRRLDGALLEKVIAEGTVVIVPGQAKLEGSLAYDLYAEAGVDAITVKAEVDLDARASLEILVAQNSSSLDARTSFNGRMNLTLDTWAGEYELAAARIAAMLRLMARQSAGGFSGSIEGSVEASWKVWIFEGSTDVDIGYRIN